MADLALNQNVMKQNKMAIYIAAALFMIVGAVLYFRPFLDTIDAVNTAGGLAANKAVVVASQTQITASRIGQTLAHAKDVDAKAIAIGLHGADCLNGSLTDGKACAK
jgi:membrane protein involved in colicin uptake